MIELFKRFLYQTLNISSSTPVLLTVSGGIDSMAMLYLFQQIENPFAVAHCNFQLRGEESERDMNFVVQYCNNSNIQIHTILFDTKSYAVENKLSIQMAARELRYDWFHQLRDEYGYEYIATGHHLDDQAETIFINLSRGTGIAGLHGIPQKTKTIIRPLLFSTREMIQNFATENKISFIEDSSNASDKYLRNQIRHNILPFFVNQNQNFLNSLAQTANQIARLESLLKNQTKNIINEMLEINSDIIKLDINQLIEIEGYDLYLIEFLTGYGFSNSVINDLIQNLNSQKSGLRFFSSTHRIVKDRNSLLITPLGQERNSNQNDIWFVNQDLTHDIPLPIDLKIITKPDNLITDNNTALFDLDKITFPLIVRQWKKGDYFYPFGMKGKKLLSDYFIDNKFSITEKESTFLLCSGNQIMWIIGYRMDNRYRIDSYTKNVLEIKLNYGNH